MTVESTPKLSVNLNKVALLRNQRDVGYPGVIRFAALVLDAGAHGITVHPRPDERHIRRSDVRELGHFLAARAEPGVEFNIEGNPSADFLRLVSEVRPEQVTLVPDTPEQRTSDHGWDFSAGGAGLAAAITRIQSAGSRVSVFVDPDPASVRGAHAAGADRIELYTEPYAAAFAAGDCTDVLSRYAECARIAGELGLGVNAGHDLTVENTRLFSAAVRPLDEVSIGHAITADALEHGFATAVQMYLDALAGR